MSEKWKKSWKSSKKAKKQRMYRANAPYHLRKKFLSVKLSDDLQDTIGKKTLPVRSGDKVEVMRGEHKGLSSLVDRVDYTNYKVYLTDIERERVDGTEAKIALEPSNLKLVKLELEDERRISEVELSEEEKKEIEAEDEKEEQEETEEAEETEVTEEKSEEDDSEEAEESEKEGSKDKGDK